MWFWCNDFVTLTEHHMYLGQEWTLNANSWEKGILVVLTAENSLSMTPLTTCQGSGWAESRMSAVNGWQMSVPGHPPRFMKGIRHRSAAALTTRLTQDPGSSVHRFCSLRYKNEGYCHKAAVRVQGHSWHCTLRILGFWWLAPSTAKVFAGVGGFVE